jgi:hypothetical protein
MTRKIPDYVGEHFAKHPIDWPREIVRPRIACPDGMEYSVQASRGHYCEPRDEVGPWTALEVWAFRGGKWRTRDPKGYVDRAKINRRIHRHGGAV